MAVGIERGGGHRLMASATSVPQFVANVERLGRRIAMPNVRANEDAGHVFGEIIDRAADRAGATSWSGGARPRYRTRTRSDGVYIRPGNVGAIVALNDGTKAHIIGARQLGTRARFRRDQQRIGATVAFGGRNQFGALRTVGGRGGRQALSWPGATHPTPYAFVSGTRGFGFIQDARDDAAERAAETWLRAKRRELIQAGR